MVDKNISTSEGHRGRRRGQRGKIKGHHKLNPLTLCVNFEKRVSPAIVKMLIDNIDDAVAIKMGKYIKVDFNSQKEAAEAKKQLIDIKCEIGQIVVDYASQNKNKRVGEDTEKPAKKAKIEGSDIIEKKDEDELGEEEEDEEETEDEEEEEEGEEEEEEGEEEEEEGEEEAEDSNVEVDEDEESNADDDTESNSDDR